MKQTQNYRLNQWEKTDRIQMEDFNGDNSKVDAALKTLANQVASKANSSTVSSLTTKVNTKAAQSDLTAETKARSDADATEKAAREALAQQHTADVAALRSENYWVKVADTTLSADAATFSCPLANVGNYAELRCLFTLVSDGRPQVDLNGGVDLLLSGRESTYRSSSILLEACTKGAGGSIHIFPMGGVGNAAIFTRAAGIQSSGYSQDMTCQMSTYTLTYANLKSIDLSSNFGTIKAGARMRVYGLKK